MRRFAWGALASLAALAACTGFWWRYWPLLKVESQVKTRLANGDTARFTRVTYNHSTRTGCGYFNAAKRPGTTTSTTHFILLPDGTLQFDPSELGQDRDALQTETMKSHTDYLALVYTRCAQE